MFVDKLANNKKGWSASNLRFKADLCFCIAATNVDYTLRRNAVSGVYACTLLFASSCNSTSRWQCRLSFCITVAHSAHKENRVYFMWVCADFKHQTFLQTMQQNIVLPDLEMKVAGNSTKRKNKSTNHLYCGPHWVTVTRSRPQMGLTMMLMIKSKRLFCSTSKWKNPPILIIQSRALCSFLCLHCDIIFHGFSVWVSGFVCVWPLILAEFSQSSHAFSPTTGKSLHVKRKICLKLKRSKKKTTFSQKNGSQNIITA